MRFKPSPKFPDAPITCTMWEGFGFLLVLAVMVFELLVLQVAIIPN